MRLIYAIRAFGIHFILVGCFLAFKLRVYIMITCAVGPIAPAQMLGLSRKGRLQVDSDADITVFDPSATTAMSAIRHVVVNGYVHNQAQSAL